MKLLFDLFPVLFFFLAYKLYGIFAATAVAIAASFIQVGAYWFKHRAFEKMHLVSLALITVLGGGTLLLQDKMLIMWKVSIFYWIVALVFLGNQMFAKKTLVQSMLEKIFALPANFWRRLNIGWILAFIMLGAVNLYFVQAFALQQKNLHTELQNNALKLSAEEITLLLAESPMKCEQNFPATTQRTCANANAAENTWVNIKLFGLSGLLFAFFLGHLAIFYRYLIVEETPSSIIK